MNIVITGGSRGIGYETALRFSKNVGNKIFVMSRDEKKLNELAARGERIIPVICDISKEENVAMGIKKISGMVDSVEVLINNAGLLINKPFLQLNLEDWKRVYDVNVFGVFMVTKGMMPLLKSGKLSEEIKSHVVNISSMGGVQGSIKFPGLSAYSSSKGALITMTECIAEEMKNEGLRANCIALGSVETEMFREAFPGVRASSKAENLSEWLVDFAINGWKFFNGKLLPLSVSNP